jgi:hypothetical protein
LGGFGEGYRLVVVGRREWFLSAALKLGGVRLEHNGASHKHNTTEEFALMKTTLKLLGAAIVTLGLADVSRAANGSMDYVLWLNSDGPNTWTLLGSTGADGGIASFVVNLDNVTSVTANPPHGTFMGTPATGFFHFEHLTGVDAPAGAESQLFGRQYANTAEDITPTTPGVAYGVGFSSVPNSEIAPAGTVLVGSALSDVLPSNVAAGFQVRLFSGTYTPGSPVAFSASPGSPITGSAILSVTGIGTGVNTMQPTNAGGVWTDDPPGDPTDVVLPTSFSYSQFMLGDMDRDGDVDGDDINPFVQGLSDPAGFQTTFGYTPESRGDMDLDGDLDGDDINPFVAVLSGSITAVPEPGSIGLFALAGLGLVALKVRRNSRR